MRKEARWTDGTRVTARDFAWSWKRLQEPETASEYAYLLHCVRHAEAYNTFGAQVKALRGVPGAEDDVARLGILGGYRALAGKGDLAVPAKAWQAFLGEYAVRDTVVRTRERVLVDAVDQTTGELTPALLADLGAAFERDAVRRETELADAKAHFGIDQGAFALDDDTFVVELTAFVPYFLDLTSFHSARPLPARRSRRTRRPGSGTGRPTSAGRRLASGRNRKIRPEERDVLGRDDVSLRHRRAAHREHTTSLNLYPRGRRLRPPLPAGPGSTAEDPPDFMNASAITYFFGSGTRKPFDDPKVRLALNAIDRRCWWTRSPGRARRPRLDRAPMRVPPPEPRLRHRRRGSLLADAGFPAAGLPPFGILYNN
jgi:hypothetical protein